jgi:hypothetical protein
LDSSRVTLTSSWEIVLSKRTVSIPPPTPSRSSTQSCPKPAPNRYASTPKQSVLNLQLVAEAMAAFDANSSDPLLNKKVQTFDFQGLVGAFDAARAATPGLSSWALSNGLTQFHLAGSDSEALGGDLAYHYGADGTLAGMGLGKAQEVLTNAQFGAQAQAINPTASLQEGLIRLG